MNTVSLEQELAVVVNSKHADNFLKEQAYEYKSVFLNRIVPDRTNPRFLPAIIMSDQHAIQLATGKLTKRQLLNVYQGENHVLIGKSCVVNCFKYGSEEWKKANATIESIIELAANISVSEIIQVPTIYPLDDDTYQILTGHRRYFALVYANGINGAAHFKAYESKPALPKTKQFQENASREDLPQYGKLMAFQDAMFEIESLNNVRKRSGRKAHTVRETANILGISMGAYDNYNVLIRYPCVRTAYENGNSLPFVTMKKLVLQVERLYKQDNEVKVLNINDRKKIDGLINDQINGVRKPKRRATAYKIKTIESPKVLKMLLTTNVMETADCVDWQSLDWQDIDAVNEALQILIKYLNDKTSHA